jgi:hypothetical protein
MRLTQIWLNTLWRALSTFRRFMIALSGRTRAALSLTSDFISIGICRKRKKKKREKQTHKDGDREKDTQRQADPNRHRQTQNDRQIQHHMLRHNTQNILCHNMNNSNIRGPHPAMCHETLNSCSCWCYCCVYKMNAPAAKPTSFMYLPTVHLRI